MRFGQRLRGSIINAYLSEDAAALRRTWERVTRPRATLETYLQLDDPYSHLLAQALGPIAAIADLQLRVEVVPAGWPDVDSEPRLRLPYAMRDAAEIAERFELSFPADAAPPEDDALELANSILLRARPARRQLEVARVVGHALWTGDATALEAVRAREGAVPRHRVAGRVVGQASLLRRRGHYQGAMMRYRGEWFWGVDRLHYLLQRLRDDGHDVPSCPAPRHDRKAAARAGEERKLEMFHSFRSPYSYLGLKRALELASRYDVPLRIKPVLPMVMRGHQVPFIKAHYIVVDAAREARRHGIAFGRICDPLGPGIARCLAVFGLAAQLGKEAAFASCAGRGAWSDALDVGRDDDLRTIVERAGIDWSAARAALDDPAGEQAARRNAEELRSLGLWGVPSFRLGDYAIWGNDRLDRIEERLAAG